MNSGDDISGLKETSACWHGLIALGAETRVTLCTESTRVRALNNQLVQHSPLSHVAARHIKSNGHCNSCRPITVECRQCSMQLRQSCTAVPIAADGGEACHKTAIAAIPGLGRVG